MPVKLVCWNDDIDLTAQYRRSLFVGPSDVFVVHVAGGFGTPIPRAPVPPVLVVCPRCQRSNVFDGDLSPPENSSPSGLERLRGFFGDDDRELAAEENPADEDQPADDETTPQQ